MVRDLLPSTVDAVQDHEGASRHAGLQVRITYTLSRRHEISEQYIHSFRGFLHASVATGGSSSLI